MITIDVCITSRESDETRNATMMAEGESYCMPCPPIVADGTAAAFCANAMAKRVGCGNRHFVCVEHDESKGFYRFAMVAGSWSF